jgi:hypothetical protein
MIALTCFYSLTGCDPDAFTLDLVGGEETEGASVYINDERAGTMNKHGEGGSRFVKRLPHGTLTIEVKKEGYTSYRETITAGSDEGERYVIVGLKPEEKTGN